LFVVMVFAVFVEVLKGFLMAMARLEASCVVNRSIVFW